MCVCGANKKKRLKSNRNLRIQSAPVAKNNDAKKWTVHKTKPNQTACNIIAVRWECEPAYHITNAHLWQSTFSLMHNRMTAQLHTLRTYNFPKCALEMCTAPGWSKWYDKESWKKRAHTHTRKQCTKENPNKHSHSHSMRFATYGAERLNFVKLNLKATELRFCLSVYFVCGKCSCSSSLHNVYALFPVDFWWLSLALVYIESAKRCRDTLSW